MPAAQEMPSTIQRSPEHAQRLWSEAHDSAVQSYGEGERAHRTAFAALKHEYEKVGDHWQKKESRGPSDEGARTGGKPTAGGVDANASTSHLRKVASELEISGRSRMRKSELVEAIQKANDAKTREARQK